MVIEILVCVALWAICMFGICKICGLNSQIDLWEDEDIWKS